MSGALVLVAMALSAVALWLPTRHQRFTRVTLDGRTIRMLVTGGGDATAVLESGYNPPLEIWGRVQPEVSTFAKTVAYDRAGVGLSDAGPSTQDGRRAAMELHRVLELAGLPPPYVLVGHSLGGLYVRIYAGLYPGEVAALVLVDPTEDADGLEGLPPVLSVALREARESHVPEGVPVFLIDARGTPETPFDTKAMRASRLKRRESKAAESAVYRQWLAGVPAGRLITTDRSGHNVPVEQPDLVIETIRQAIRARR